MMRYTTILACGLLTLTLSAAAAEPSFEQVLQECLPGMSAAEIPAREQAQQRLQTACHEASRPGREAERMAAGTLLAAHLTPTTAKPAQIWLLRQLQLIGREECVEALATVLKGSDRELRDCACRALVHNPTPSANATLVAALQQAQEEDWKLALIHALGTRGNAASVSVLQPLLGSSQERLARAAALALGKIGTPEALAGLEAARAGASGELRIELGEACLRCAERLMASGKTAEALAIYAKLASGEEARPVRLGALQGQLRAAGPNAVALVLQWLSSGDADTRALAAGEIAQLPAEATPTLVDGYAKLPMTGKVLLLAGLAARGGEKVASLALEASGSDQPELRLAGVAALAKVGDGACVPRLVAMLEAEGEPDAAARESLLAMTGQGVDEALIRIYQEASPKLRAILIGLFDTRRAECAVPTLLTQVAASDPALRACAIGALRNVAQPDALPELVPLLAKVEAGREREELEKTITEVAERIADPEQQAAAVLTRLSGADVAETCILLPVLGRLGGEKAHAVVQTLQESTQPEVRDAAVRALCNWPDASVAPELMTLVNSTQGEELRLRALRAYIRVVSLPSKRPATETLEMLQLAWSKATRTEERKLILSRAPSARCVETFRWVVPYLDDPDLVREASLAVVELAHHRELMRPNQTEFRAALKKVTEVCKDPQIADRAKRYLEGL